MARKKSSTESKPATTTESGGAFTFGELLGVIGDSEQMKWLAQQQRSKGTGTVPGSVELLNLKNVHHYEREAARYRSKIPQSAGVERLKTICESEQILFNEESLKMLRGRLCKQYDMVRKQVNELPVDEVAEMLWKESTESGIVSSPNKQMPKGELKNSEVHPSVPPRFQSAFLAYLYVEDRVTESLTDAEVYHWLKENGGPDGYGLPPMETFKRYLRGGRKAIADSKKTCDD